MCSTALFVSQVFNIVQGLALANVIARHTAKKLRIALAIKASRLSLPSPSHSYRRPAVRVKDCNGSHRNCAKHKPSLCCLIGENLFRSEKASAF